jgi:hypothetical protein
MGFDITQHIEHVRAEALFASDLQRSSAPEPALVRHAVAGALRRYGSEGCTAVVANEFGEHPEVAVARMTWALQAVRASFAAHDRDPGASLRASTGSEAGSGR